MCLSWGGEPQELVGKLKTPIKTTPKSFSLGSKHRPLHSSRYYVPKSGKGPLMFPGTFRSFIKLYQSFFAGFKFSGFQIPIISRDIIRLANEMETKLHCSRHKCASKCFLRAASHGGFFFADVAAKPLSIHRGGDFKAWLG